MTRLKKTITSIPNRENGFALISILLALIIIAILYLLVIRVYFGSSPTSKETEEILNEQGIETDNYKSLIESTRQKRDKVNQELERRKKYLEEIK